MKARIKHFNDTQFIDGFNSIPFLHISWLEPVEETEEVKLIETNQVYCKTNSDMDSVLKTLGGLYDKKNSDYALSGSPYSNFEQAASTAGVSVDEVFRTMIGIKLARIVSLQNENKVINFESLSDTILDLANYACIYAAYTKSKELK